ncbi:MAG: phosphatidate cytidylyltransferase [Muribaculaceae bacterium]|nr:phosphatidate cytidylyltransferase [Muribaculaceae bacterium]
MASINLKSWLVRSLSGLVYVGAIVGCVFWGRIPFSILMALIGILAVVEFEKICEGISENNLPLLILDAVGVVFLAFGYIGVPLIAWIFVFLCRLILQLYTTNDRPIRSMALSFMTQIYIGGPIMLLNFLSTWIGTHLALAIFLMIWINDTGAFVVGSLFGRHRLFERISPKKSWEGFFGGLAFNCLAGWLFAIGGTTFWDTNWNVITWILFALTITLFSTWGDLVESLIKRSLNIKDSGHIMPGHGGILDRIDSLLLVAPAAFLFILIAEICGQNVIPFHHPPFF